MLAESDERALEILTKRSFDLVVTNLLMHEATGWQVLSATKRQYPDTKVIVFTGYGDEQGEALLVNRKADGFLVKPLRLDKLTKMLAGLLTEVEVVGGRIIAVDDEPITQMMIEITLADAGHEVRLFSSAVEALETAKTDPPDLFLIDIEMPHVDGFELCAQIRDLDVTCDIPIIIVTVHSDPTHRYASPRSRNPGFSTPTIPSPTATHTLPIKARREKVSGLARPTNTMRKSSRRLPVQKRISLEEVHRPELVEPASIANEKSEVEGSTVCRLRILNDTP